MAARYWVGGGTNSNWNSAPITNWSTTSGGANGAAAPTSADDVIFDGAGTGNVNSIISATTTVLSLTITSGYTATLTHNALLTISTGGSITLGANYTIAGASSITLSGNISMTSNGRIWPNAITTTGSGSVKTLNDNWRVNGLFTSGANGIQTYNGFTLTLAGGFTITNTGDQFQGTTNVVMLGGNWQGNGIMGANISFQGNVTIAGVGLDFGGASNPTMTYVSGTVVHTGTITFSGTCILNTAGIVWNIVIFTGNNTFTLNSLFTVTGTTTLNTASNIVFAGTHGFVLTTLIILSQAAQTVTLAAGITYQVNTTFTANDSRKLAILHITSNHATNKAILTIVNGATASVLANFTRIDASNGRTINTFVGVVTDCLNVNSFSDLRTIVRTFIQ